MSDGLGRKNRSGSEATKAGRSSFGNPNPIIVSSRLKATYTICFTRSLIRPCTTTSYERSKSFAYASTSSTETPATATERRFRRPVSAGAKPPRRRAFAPAERRNRGSHRNTLLRSCELEDAVVQWCLEEGVLLGLVDLRVDPRLAVALLGHPRHRPLHVARREAFDPRSAGHVLIGLAQPGRALIGARGAHVVEQAAHESGDEVAAHRPRRVDVA